MMNRFGFGQAIATLANIGVIVGIVFLTLELRQNNVQLTAQSRYNYYQGRVNEYWSVVNNKELLELMYRANTGQPLDDVERNRVTQRMMALITGWEYEFGEKEFGRISDEEFNVAAKREVYRSLPALIEVWTNYYRPLAPAPFREFMDTEISGR